MPDARNRGNALTPVEDPRGVWMAYYPDGSGFAIFSTEIDALRHAVGHRMDCRFQE